MASRSKPFAGRHIVLLDRGQGHGVQQLRALDLGHRHDGQVVVALRATGQNKVVLGGKHAAVVTQGIREQALGIGYLPRVSLE